MKWKKEGARTRLGHRCSEHWSGYSCLWSRPICTRITMSDLHKDGSIHIYLCTNTCPYHCSNEKRLSGQNVDLMLHIYINRPGLSPPSDRSSHGSWTVSKKLRSCWIASRCRRIFYVLEVLWRPPLDLASITAHCCGNNFKLLESKIFQIYLEHLQDESQVWWDTTFTLFHLKSLHDCGDESQSCE